MQGDGNALSLEQMKQLAPKMEAQFGLRTGDYDWEELPDWDHPRVLLFRAQPKLPIERTMVVAVVDGALIAPLDDDAFERVIGEGFVEIDSNDCPMLARLAILFGRWSHAIGDLVVDWMPPSVGGPIDLPRDDLGPVYMREGGNHRIDFYTHNIESMVAYDCSLIIAPEGPTLTANRLRPRKTDGASASVQGLA